MRTVLLSLGIVLLSVLQQPSPDASISGRVTNAASRPIGVAAGSIGYHDGRRVFARAISGQLNSDGSFELRNVKPGEYYLRVEAPVPTYYPGTRDIDAAIRIAVKAGQELVGIDIDANRGPEFKVSGILQNIPVATGAIGVLNSIPAFTFASTDRRTLDPSALTQDVLVKPSGEFEINLPAGEWDIFPVIQNPQRTAFTPLFMTGRSRALVRDRNVDNVIITVSSVDVKGRAVLSGFPPESAAGLRIALLPKDNYPPMLVQHLRTPHATGAAGEFTFPGVPPGRYLFQVSTISSGFYVADIRVGTKSIFDDGILTVGTESIDPVEVVLSSDGGLVRTIPTGVIAALAVDGSLSRIVLIPVDRRENTLLYKSFSSVQGVSGVRDVAPGRYKVFAFQELLSGGAEMDAEFMAPYEDMGVTIDVAGGQTVEVRVPWIPAEVMRRQ